MRFTNWVLEKTPRGVAKMIGTESPTIYSWLARRCSPSALTMQKLVRLGKGAFDYDDIISETKGTPRALKVKRGVRQ